MILFFLEFLPLFLSPSPPCASLFFQLSLSVLRSWAVQFADIMDSQNHHPSHSLPSSVHTLTPSRPHTLTHSHRHYSSFHTVTPSHPHTLTPHRSQLCTWVRLCVRGRAISTPSPVCLRDRRTPTATGQAALSSSPYRTMHPALSSPDRSWLAACPVESCCNY